MVRLLSIVAAVALLAPGAAAADDAAAGRTMFQTNCAACHMAAAHGRALVGPNLFGVVGRAAGTVPGFRYSPAMRTAGFTWTQEKLVDYLQHPARTVPGTSMPFRGLTRPADAAAVAAYLASQH